MDLVGKFVMAAKNLEYVFDKNELAYLSITQKNEHALRDRIAFQLHQELSEVSPYQVSREWLRTDLAILKEGAPHLMVEAKSIYSFNVIEYKKSYPYDLLLDHDAEKSYKFLEKHPNNKDCPVLLFLTATHIIGDVDEKCKQSIKYFSDLKKSKNVSIDFIQRKVLELINHKCITYDVISAGTAFGVDVKVLYWIFEAGKGHTGP